MSEYIVSARKYRPDSFETLIGQDNIAQTLKNSITRGQLAHAYLFCGPRGVGKTSAARIFAKTINCANPSADMEPCGECESCRSFAEGRSYCIHELDAASNNGVDDIKALMDKVQIPPQVGRYSVYIIDEVHMLSQAAFNAFLKTLEEPPAHAIFILATTEKHKIIPTILSRCQTYDFNRISVPDIVGNLKSIAVKENIHIDDESLHVIAHKADGAMRDALTIFDQTVAFCGTDIKYEDVIRNLNVLDYEYSFKLVDAFLAKDHATALLTFDEILRKGFNSLHFVTALSSHLRDLLVSKTGGLDSLLDLPDSLKARYRDQASRCSLKFIFDALGITTQCEAGYRAAANQRLHIEYSLMKLSFLIGVPEVAATVKPAAPAATVKTADSSPSVGTSASEAPKAAVADAPRGETVVTRDLVNGRGPAERLGGMERSESFARGDGSNAAPKASAEPVEAPAEPVIEAVELDIEPEIIEVSEPVAVAAPAPAPAPEAAPAPAPAAKPTARKRPAKTGASLSMDALLNMEEIEIVPVEEEVKVDTLPDDETLAARWQDLAKSTPQPRLANALANAKLDIREEEGNKIVEFSVTNEAQKRWIEEKMLHDLEGRYRKLTDCTKVRLVPAVMPDENQEPVIYMPAEKAEYLMKNNSEVLGLVTDLGLDI